jgi:Uma2 family endonuclease
MFRRLTVDQYHQMIQTGILADGEAVELLEGYLVNKMAHNNPHRLGVQWLGKRLHMLGLSGWVVLTQLPITLADSEPEPDGCLARGDDRTYLTRHPGPGDVGLVVEVADSSLAFDRIHKGRIYAREGIPSYWIVNVADRLIEVYTDPDPAADPPAYRNRTDYHPGDTVPIVLDGQPAGSIAVADLIP